MKTFKRLSRLLIAVGLSALAVSPVTFAAGNVDGYINGEVTTTGGQPVADASVTATNTDTGFSRTLSTDADGNFRFVSMSIGPYTLTVDKSGYQSASRNLTVNVGVGTDAFVTLLAAGEDAAQLGTVTVTGAGISPIDITSSDSSLVVGEAKIDRIPVGRDLASVAQLAPTTVAADPNFGGTAFGGASAAENRCYINGLNVTNFRNGLGCNTVPFEFYKEFQVKTGGWSPEFGGVTGGVINAVTKSGTNEFEFGGGIFIEPWIDDLSGTSPDVYRPNGALFFHNKLDERTTTNINLWASGPIIKDKLFFFALYNPRDVTTDNYSGTPSQLYENEETDDAFWGTKIDWNITDRHTLEFTAFSDSREVVTTTYDFTFNGADPSAESGTIGAALGQGFSERGGENFILKYTGYFTDNLTVSVLAGQNKYSLTDSVDPTSLLCPAVFDSRGGTTMRYTPSCFVQQGVSTDNDTRDVFRVDAEWFLGDHTLRFGIDKEDNTANSIFQYSGNITYEYFTSIDADGDGLPDDIGNTATVPLGQDFVTGRVFSNGGEFAVDAFATYVEDQWFVTNNLVLNLGLRFPTYENLNSAGDPFIKIDGQVAPRLGASWDINGDGSMKLFGSYGRYFLPIAGNTNIRATGTESDVTTWYTFTGIDPVTGAPTGLTQVGPVQVTADGLVPDTRTVLDSDFDAMYQDELIIGFSRDAGNGWVWGIRGIYRELPSAIDDITIDGALLARGLRPSAFNYVLANPGQDVTVYYDNNDDGTLTADELYTFTNAELKYPEPTRKYGAIAFDFEKVWDGVWFLQGSYTLSHSYGNTEGYVKSDINQDDAGVTQDFDFAELMTATYGNLPNDRRHVFKVFGAYKFAPNWQLGANVLMQSGRPINAIGFAPGLGNASLYQNSFFYRDVDTDGLPGYYVPRGSYGTTNFLTQIDLSLEYATEVGEGDLTVGMDVFNIFNAGTETQVSEFAENGAGGDLDSWTLPNGFQQPRTIRLRAEVSF